MTATRPGTGIRRVLVLGANGPTGRLVVRQAADRGLEVVALTRNPDAFPVRDDRVEVVGGDATDPATMDRAVEGCDAVLSAIGTAYTWRPVQVYSASARLAVTAMRRHGVRRLVVVTSAGAPRHPEVGGPVQRAGMLLLRRTFARTLYDDMLELERIAALSALDWTVVRPPGLSDDAGRGYTLAEHPLADPGMAREDLAAALLDQVTDDRWIGRTVAVATPGLRLDPVEMVRKEMLKR